MFERILVPLDGSRVAESALAGLRPILRRRRSELLLVRAVSPTTSAAAREALRGPRNEAERYLADLVRRLDDAGIPARSFVRRGRPAPVIQELAEQERATLIVLSTQGLTGLEHALFGSVTEELLRRSSLPLIVFRTLPDAEEDPWEAARTGFRRILVPLDGGPVSRSILPAAGEMASLFRSQVLLLRVLESDAPGPLQESRRSARLALESEAAPLAQAGVPTELILTEGEPASQIQSVAWEEQADLIAMATRGRSGPSRLLVGSVTERILRSALLPVLAIRGAAPPLRKSAP